LLTRIADQAIADPANDLLLSAATIWEIAIKVGIGKLSLSLPYTQWMDKAVADLGATLLPITVNYAGAQAALPNHHGDPFDRLIVAQAQVENLTIVSSDSVFDRYGVFRVWE
jgi:PIN domain nuclease of toxin-antitoxin system